MRLVGGEHARRPVRVAVAAVTVLAAGGALAVGSGSHASAASTVPPPAVVSPRTPFVQTNCPGTVPVFPPGSSFYGVPLASKIVGGSLTVGRITKTTGVSATICGLLKFPELTATIPATSCNATTEQTGCISYGTATTTIDGLVDLPTTFVPGPTTVTVGQTAAPNGGLELTISAQVTTEVHVQALGVVCGIGPITVTLTTETSGPLTGADVTGPLTGASARIVGATFAVPAGTASTTCPTSLLPATDKLVGLPLAPGAAQFTAPLSLANSLT